MKFIVKLFPEITIKSQSLRLRFIKILSSNIRNVLKSSDEKIAVVRHWDYIEVRTKNTAIRQNIIAELKRIPGIHHFLEVDERPFDNIHHIFTQTFEVNQKRLEGKTFCVRVKRRGTHDFSSQDVERYVGGGLKQKIPGTKVNLTDPEVKVHLEIEQDCLRLVTERYEGLGGFPLGTQENVLSLLSGGFDSSVASHMLIRRGCRVHYCFFNLGGVAHEIGVRQVAYHLWSNYARSHRVRFISVNFAPIVAEILERIDDGQMGVILKRMMLRVATCLAERYGFGALVTGEALGQVSSQTLTNLGIIDEVSNALILRPLVSHDKEHIINMARAIGTEKFANTMPEYCGVISKKPTAKAIKAVVELQEANFNFELLDQAIQDATCMDIRDIASQIPKDVFDEVETVTVCADNESILDIRTLDEQEMRPLRLKGVEVKSLPFYKLNTEFPILDKSKIWLLYCDRGVMSRLQALHLHEKGFKNVKVLGKMDD